jgi:hypothetical protein
MKLPLTYILAVMFMIATHAADAQILNSTTVWNSAVSINLNTGNTQHAVVEFETNASTVKMREGASVIVFNIQSAEGDWNNIGNTGKFTLQILDDANTPGRVVMGRDENGVYIILDMTPGNPDGINQRFNINAYRFN